MPEIKPFRGILYNAIKVHLENVVAPPYDVISPDMQEELYKKNPYNIVRLILNSSEDTYSSAAKFLSEWKQQKVLIMDSQPAFYVLSMRYRGAGGNLKERKGFIAACKMEEKDSESIVPHEQTLSKPREDRLRLFESTCSMFSQIFGLYSDPRGVVDSLLDSIRRSIPFAEIHYGDVEFRLWALRDKTNIQTISEFIKRRKILIADGHHRYEAARSYRDITRSKTPASTGREPFNYIPMYFTNLHAPGLTILPTHRIIHGLAGFNETSMMNDIAKHFTIVPDVTREKLFEELQSRRKGAFGVILATPHNFSLVYRNDNTAVPSVESNDKTANLDVAILHKEILEKILGITPEMQRQMAHIQYEIDAGIAIDAVSQKKAQVAFLLNPTNVEELQVVAEAGQMMPQKSTYFYPKLLSGLVNYSFTDE
ncbi:MAG: DUF1015 domain-containing protein [Bacteroidota bacterium]